MRRQVSDVIPCVAAREIPCRNMLLFYATFGRLYLNTKASGKNREKKLCVRMPSKDFAITIQRLP